MQLGLVPSQSLTIYRRPSSSTIEFYKELSDMYDIMGDVIEADKFVTCGDCNFDGDCSTLVSSDIQAVLDTRGLHQVVVLSTYLLDLVIGRLGIPHIYL